MTTSERRVGRRPLPIKPLGGRPRPLRGDRGLDMPPPDESAEMGLEPMSRGDMAPLGEDTSLPPVGEEEPPSDVDIRLPMVARRRGVPKIGACHGALLALGGRGPATLLLSCCPLGEGELYGDAGRSAVGRDLAEPCSSGLDSLMGLRVPPKL